MLNTKNFDLFPFDCVNPDRIKFRRKFMALNAFIQESIPFLEYLVDWQSNLPAVRLSEVCALPDKTAILSVDVINGFCYEGPLASPRVKKIIDPIVDLFQRSWDLGVHNILLFQDTHNPKAIEFGQFPPHCIRGTQEADTVPEIKKLPFFEYLIVLEKNSINAAIGTGLDDWIIDHPEKDTFIVVGDCTDLCTYQLAMFLKLDANNRMVNRRVVTPANAVDTYDMPVEMARSIGAMPHDGDLLHALFLYHMALNGVEVVSRLS
jgi:nicotinamidase-related amidase